MAIHHLLRPHTRPDGLYNGGSTVSQPLSRVVSNAESLTACRWQVPSPRLRPLVRLGLVGLVCANLAFTGISTFFSVHNYPGGEVWEALEDLKISGSSNHCAQYLIPVLLVYR